MTSIEKHQMCTECLNDTWMEITKVRNEINSLIIDIERMNLKVKKIREGLNFVITNPMEGIDDMDMALFSIYADKVIGSLTQASSVPMMTPDGLK